jgi:superfamily II DNA or RNA helicase
MHMPRYRSGSWDGYVHLFTRSNYTFPGGLVDRVAMHLISFGVTVSAEDRSQAPWTEPQLIGGANRRALRDYQHEAVDKALVACRGVFEAATGLGKTEIMAEMVRRLACRTLVLVHDVTLAKQTINRFKECLTFPNLGDEDDLYGLFGDSIEQPGLITVALYQTLHRRLTPICTSCGQNGKRHLVKCKCGGVLDFSVVNATEDWLTGFDAIHLDEAHHVPATTWWPIVNSCPAYWRFGYSATPFKSDDGTEHKLVGATGEVIFSFKAKEAIEEGWLVKPHVIFVRPSFPAFLDEPSFAWAYTEGIAEHLGRNRLIADIAVGLVRELGAPTLILVQRIVHGKELRRELRALGMDVDFLSGSTASSDDRLAAINGLRTGKIKCLITTTIFDEGVNAPEIGALILAGGGKARHKQLQRIGRGLRPAEGKDYLPVIDLWDDHSDFLLGHSHERLEAVKGAGFDWEELTPDQILARIKHKDVRSPV